MYGWHTLKTCWKKSFVSHWLVLYFALQTLKLAAMNLKLSLCQGNKCSWYKTCLHTEQALTHTHKLEDFRLSHFFGIFYKNKYTLSSLAQGTCHMKTVQPYFFLLLVSNSCFWLSSIKVQQKHTHKIFRKLWNIFCFFHSFLFFLLFLCGGGLCLVEVSFLNGTKQLSWCKVAVNKATV